jgi:hypothetical protein
MADKRTPELITISLWRLLIVTFALYGFGAATGWAGHFEALSQQASLFTGIVYTGLLCYPLLTKRQQHEPRSPWLRGATTVLLLLVAVTFFTVLGGDLEDQPFEHLYTPLVVLLDWLFVGRNQANAKWWYPLTWVTFPLAYFAYYLAADLSFYHFLNSPNAGMIAAFLVALIATGYVLLAAGRFRKPDPSAPRTRDRV